ncbi:MAG: sugar ABC transporter substrate-binding protein, partial [Ruthenibacterium sp.]
TSPEQNSTFTASVGFLPVQTPALTESAIREAREQARDGAPNPAITTALQVAQNMLDTYTLFNSKPFSGDYEVKQLLEVSLPDLAKQDLQDLEQRAQTGENRQQLIAEYNSNEHFEQWYDTLIKDANTILAEKRI